MFISKFLEPLNINLAKEVIKERMLRGVNYLILTWLGPK